MKRLLRFGQRIHWFVRRRIDPAFRVQLKRPLQKHGSDYGGWMIDPTQLNADSIVYSFGVGQDISFDLSLIETFGCHVYAFDPTPKSVAWINAQNLPTQFHFLAYGIAAHDGEVMFNPPINPEYVSYTMLERPETASEAIQVPVLCLQTIMQRLGHQRLDMLKMDVEGTEYEVLQQLCTSDLLVDQILVEFHHRFAAVGWRQTQTAIHALHQTGYQTFYVSPTVEEFSFLRVQS